MKCALQLMLINTVESDMEIKERTIECKQGQL